MSAAKWDLRFLRLAQEVASWSKDPSTKVGCVIVDPDRRVVSLGFNGFPVGIEDSESRLANRPYKLVVTLHAEENALFFAGRRMKGCTAYVTHHPCGHCTAKLIQAGILRIVYIADYTFQARWLDHMNISSALAYEAGLTLQPYEQEDFNDQQPQP